MNPTDLYCSVCVCVCALCVFEGRVSERDAVKRQKDVLRKFVKDLKSAGKFQDEDTGCIVERKTNKKTRSEL